GSTTSPVRPGARSGRGRSRRVPHRQGTRGGETRTVPMRATRGWRASGRDGLRLHRRRRHAGCPGRARPRARARDRSRPWRRGRPLSPAVPSSPLVDPVAERRAVTTSRNVTRSFQMVARDLHPSTRTNSVNAPANETAAHEVVLVRHGETEWTLTGQHT